MTTDHNSTNEDLDTGPARGPYDLAMFLARSFGKALPVVVIIGLIAYGSWRAITEMSQLQTRLIETERRVSEAERKTADAEIKKTQFEADAKAAADRARYDALSEYSKQLTALNDVSVGVSKRLQELVSAQIDNMKKADELGKAQDEKTRQYQNQIEKASRDELAALRVQIAEAQKKAEELTRTASLSVYNDVKENIANQLIKGETVDDQVLDNVLGRQVDDPVVRKQAIADVADNNQKWNVRLAILLQLFKKTSDPTYLENARSIVEEHKREMREGEAALFTRSEAFSDTQEKMAIPVMAGIVADDTVSKAVRDELAKSYAFGQISSKEVEEIIGEEILKKVVRFAGARLIEVCGDDKSYCYEVGTFVDVVHGLSEEAELVYVTEALKNVKGANSEQKECIKKRLEKSLETGRPTTEMTQRWLPR